MRKLLQTYEEKENLSVPNYDDVHGKALLLAMGISIGDQVMINEEKVNDCSNVYVPDHDQYKHNSLTKGKHFTSF